jgi:hypothetical protein
MPHVEIAHQTIIGRPGKPVAEPLSLQPLEVRLLRLERK